MVAKKSQKVQNSTKAAVNPTVNRAKEATKDVANAAKKALHKATKAPQVSIDLDTDNSKDEEIAKLKAENNRLRQASAAAANDSSEPKIPRPIMDSKLQLRDIMGLTDNPMLYNTIRRSIKRHVDHAGLDASLRWHEQPKETIVTICLLAKSEHPYLKRFAHNWVTEEFIKRLMKNRQEYGQRLARKTCPSAEEEDNVRSDNGDEEGINNEGDGVDD